MYTASKNVYRERVDFAKINTSIPIPNLIEIQKNSYERFLQMRVLARRARGRRPAVGVQERLPDHATCARTARWSSSSTRSATGNASAAAWSASTSWAGPARFCAATIITDPRGDREIHCPKCGHLNENKPRHLRHLRRARGPEAQVRRRRVPGAGHDLRGAPEGHHPPRGLGQGPGHRGQDHPRHQGAGGLLRRHPADDGERDLHHQRDGAGHRQPAPPLARRLLLPAGEGPLRGPDHPLPRELGGVRVRLQEPPARAHRPQAQVPGHGLPARHGPQDATRRS